MLKKNTPNHESYISVDLLNTNVSMFLCLIKCEIAEGSIANVTLFPHI